MVSTLPTVMPSFTFETRVDIPDTVQALQERIKSLFIIKDELDRELEILMGRKGSFDVGKPWHCIRCDHKWLSKLPHRPRMCPKCKVPKFDMQPTFTYAERAKQKKAEYERVRANMIAEPQPALPHSVITRSLPKIFPDPDVATVTLTPPPVAPTTGMTLRERLAQMNARPKEPVEPTPAPEPVNIEHATDDELVEAINGDDAS